MAVFERGRDVLALELRARRLQVAPLGTGGLPFKCSRDTTSSSSMVRAVCVPLTMLSSSARSSMMLPCQGSAARSASAGRDKDEGRALLERADVPQQIACDCRDVLPALAQRRHVDPDDRQHASQVVAHTALVRGAVESSLDAGDRPHVEADAMTVSRQQDLAVPQQPREAELAAAEAVR